MSAYIKVVNDQDWDVLKKYLNKDVILIRKDVADQLETKIGKSVNECYLEGYDFGGEADIWVDTLLSDQQYAYERVLEEWKAGRIL